MAQAPLVSERRPLLEHLPALTLFGVLLLLSLSLLYPSAAWPWNGLGVGSALIIVLVGAVAILRRPMAVLPSVAGTFCLLWLGCWWISLARSPVPPIGREIVYTQFVAALAFLCCFAGIVGWNRDELLPESSDQLSPLVLVAGWLALLLGIAALYGVYQSLGPASFPKTFRSMEADIAALPLSNPSREGLLHAVRERRAAGTIGAPNIFATFCAAGVPLAGAMVFVSRRAIARVAFAGLSVAAVWAVILSGSQGGVLATMLGIGVFVLALACSRLSDRAALRLIGGGVLLLAILAIGFVSIKLLSDADRSRWLGTGGMTQRILYWKTAAAIWMEHPVLGSGAGGFEIFYPSHRMPGSNETRHAHSWLFAWLADVGFLGTAIYFGFVLAVGLCGLKSVLALRRREEGRAGLLVVGVLAGWLVLLAHGLVEYSLSHREVVLTFFVLSGVLVGVYTCLLGKDRAYAMPVRLVFAVLTISVAVFATARWQYIPALAASLEEQAGYSFSEGGTPEEFLSLARRNVEVDPKNPKYWENLGYFRLATGDPGGLQDYTRASALNPHSARLHERIAFVYAERGNGERALAEQRQAVALHPLDGGHRLNLVGLQLRFGSREEARETFLSTLDLKLVTAEERRKADDYALRLGIDPADRTRDK